MVTWDGMDFGVKWNGTFNIFFKELIRVRIDFFHDMYTLTLVPLTVSITRQKHLNNQHFVTLKK